MGKVSQDAAGATWQQSRSHLRHANMTTHCHSVTTHLPLGHWLKKKIEAKKKKRGLKKAQQWTGVEYKETEQRTTVELLESERTVIGFQSNKVKLKVIHKSLKCQHWKGNPKGTGSVIHHLCKGHSF